MLSFSRTLTLIHVNAYLEENAKLHQFIRESAMFRKLAMLTALAVASIDGAFAQTQQPDGTYWPWPWQIWSDYGWQYWWAFPIVMMLVMFSFCALMFFLFRHMCGGMFRSSTSASDPTQSALQILNERFARSEIKRDEYEQKKATILEGSAHYGRIV